MRQSISYSHTQTGTLILIAMGIGAVAIVLPMAVSTGSPAGIALLILFGLIMYAFGSLTVEVRHGTLAFWFGPGLIKKSYSIDDISDVEPVKNPWYYGWGIRYTPRGWLYNVSGRFAIELTLKSGKRLRIGTDEPDRLANVVQRALENQGAGTR